MHDLYKLLNKRQVYALIPHFTDGHGTRLLLQRGERFEKDAPFALLKKICWHAGASYEGRAEAVRKEFGFCHKVPVSLIAEKAGFFPTTSPSNPMCIWISQHPLSIEKVRGGAARLHFESGASLDVPVSPSVVQEQHLRLAAILQRSPAKMR